MLETFYLSSFFSKYFFKKLCFQLPHNVTWTDEITHVIKHEWGNIGPSCLFCEHGDLSFLLHFSKQCLVGNIQGKFQKNRSTTFISEESP